MPFYQLTKFIFQPTIQVPLCLYKLQLSVPIGLHMYCELMAYYYTSVMIYHRGASLSEQHTDLLICHCIKQDLSRTSRYLGIT